MPPELAPPAAGQPPAAPAAPAQANPDTTPPASGEGPAAHAGAAPAPAGGSPSGRPPEAWEGFRQMAQIEAEKIALRSQLDARDVELKRLRELDAGLRDRSKKYDLLEREYGADIKEWSARKLNGAPGTEEMLRSLEERVESLSGALQERGKEVQTFQESVEVQTYARDLGQELASEAFAPVRQYLELQEALTGIRPDLEADLRPHLRQARDPQTGRPIPAARTAEIMLERAKERIQVLAKVPWLRELVLGAPVPAVPAAPAPVAPAPGSRAPAPAPAVSNAGESQSTPRDPSTLTMAERMKILEEKLTRASAARAQSAQA